MPRCCKICASKYRFAIDYLHLKKGYPYRKLIKSFTGWAIKNLNLMNLSTHFNKHIYPYEEEMFKHLEKLEPLPGDIVGFMRKFHDRWIEEKRDLPSWLVLLYLTLVENL